MVTEHFYLRNDDARMPYIKVNLDSVIMVQSNGSTSFFYLVSDGGVVKAKSSLSVADCYIKYFKRGDEFIRSSPECIININYIISASRPKNGYMSLEMKGGNKATLRVSHLYAQKIIRSSDKKESSFASMPRTAIDSIKKDEIILEYPNVIQARQKIREELGEKVSTVYIRQRAKTLMSYE